MSIKIKVWWFDENGSRTEQTIDLSNTNTVTNTVSIDSLRSQLLENKPELQKEVLDIGTESPGTWSTPGVITWKKLKSDLHDVYNGTCFRKHSKKTTYEKKEYNPNLFGLDLTEVLYKQNKLQMKHKTLPLLVVECIKWLKEHNALEEEGLFRVSPAGNDLAKVKQEYDEKGTVDLNAIPNLNCHVVTGLLKLFFRELPKPIVPFKFYPKIMSVMKNSEESTQVKEIVSMYKEFPQENRDIFLYLCQFLYEVSKKSDINKMNITNLATCFAPSLLREEVEQKTINISDITLCNNSIALVISNISDFVILPTPILSPNLSPAGPSKRLSMGVPIGGMHLMDKHREELQKKLKNITNTGASSSNPQLGHVPAKTNPEKLIPLKSFSFDVSVTKFKWIINAIEREKYKTMFSKYNKNGFISFEEARSFEHAKPLETEELEKLLVLVDSGDGKLDLKEFCLFMFLAVHRVKGSISSIPDKIPESLVESASFNAASSGNSDFRAVLKKPTTTERSRSSSKAEAPVIAPWMQEIKTRPVSSILDESQMRQLQNELKKEKEQKIDLRGSDVVVPDEPPPYES